MMVSYPIRLPIRSPSLVEERCYRNFVLESIVFFLFVFPFSSATKKNTCLNYECKKCLNYPSYYLMCIFNKCFGDQYKLHCVEVVRFTYFPYVPSKKFHCAICVEVIQFTYLPYMCKSYTLLFEILKRLLQEHSLTLQF